MAKKLTLAILVTATLSETGMIYAKEKEVAPLVKSGYAEINPELKNEAGEVAARATQAGIDAHNRAVAKENAPVEDFDEEPEQAIEESKTETKGSKMTYEILDEQLPEVKQTRNRSSKYPFEQLQVGQSFKVMDSDFDNNDAHSAMASAVAAANRRYSEEIEGEVTTVKRGAQVGKEVPARRQLRLFKQVRIAGGTQIGRVE